MEWQHRTLSCLALFVWVLQAQKCESFKDAPNRPLPTKSTCLDAAQKPAVGAERSNSIVSMTAVRNSPSLRKVPINKFLLKVVKSLVLF